MTTLGITVVMVTTRDVTGSDRKVKTDGGQLLALFAGSIVFGFLVLYLVFADQAGWWLLGRYLVSIPAELALLQAMRERYPNAFGRG